MPTDPPCVILAGGQARRMGGGDKGLLPLGSGRVIDHVIARLAPQCGALAINANGDPARFADFGLPVLADPVPGQPGPLAGILAAMDWAAGHGAGVVVTAASDTPFLPRDLVARLATAATGGGAVAEGPDEAGRVRAHPTFGLWPVALRDRLAEMLAEGERRVGVWATVAGAGRACFPADPVDPFFNVNTPEDLATAERLVTLAG
ncbi:MAG: molybdenum cofactor guanylyltransferase MobA [Rhodobacteraceae bacterium]|nr:molybdenum cofactor guanylyltransferase MobA [uncultured Defluviimonas sp.]MCB2125525.1 molybdenum cofactor guanylyltransferase MobA [Paracoccaceae bacterium]MCC0071267.1 molybdenum cofactor guanylyltransferase MobA [Paracoccaceae bacterium]